MFGSEKYDAIYNGTKSFKVVKSGVTKIFSGFCSKIKVDSHDSLLVEKILTLHNVIMHIKPVLNKDKNHYHYWIFLEKCSGQWAKK